MKKVFALFFLTIFVLNAFVSFAQADDKKKKKSKQKKTVNVSLKSVSQKIKGLKADEEFLINGVKLAERWKPYITMVREGKINRVSAIDTMNKFTNTLWDFMEANIKAKRIKKYSDKEWVFPVRGYNSNAIGGVNGSGYVLSDFDFYDLHSGGHPAHDIFIYDNNQDCLDDVTGEYVDILSMSGGIVVETRTNWDESMMDIKGGNIVYVYDNYSNGFFYYAHLKEVNVKVGDFVKPGTVLGTMGRTGKNAFPSRSPTHLHIMYVRSFDGEILPENIYKDLLYAKLTE